MSFSAASPERDELLRSIPDSFSSAVTQYDRLLESVKTDPKIPRTFVDREVKTVAPKDWTSGFVPGAFWYLYKFRRGPKWLVVAKAYLR